MKYAYGASFNCNIGFDAIGGGSENCVTLDYISNNLQLLEAALESLTEDYVIDTTHEFVGQGCDVGGEVIAVLGKMSSDGEYFEVDAVIFEDPESVLLVDQP